MSLGSPQREAERRLEQVLAEIQVGVWRSPTMSAGGEDPTFHEFASRWWFGRKLELRPTTQADYESRLRKRLLPFFHAFQVSAITIALVDEYRSEKGREWERIVSAITIALVDEYRSEKGREWERIKAGARTAD